VHVVPQLMPPVLLVTPPLPVPAGATVNPYEIAVNVAVTDFAALIVTLHVVPVPLQPPPLHPANVEPPLGVSVSVTDVPEAKLFAQVPPPPQSMPPVLLVTPPPPVPAGVTVKAKSVPTVLKVAVTACAALIVTVHVAAVPEQPPPLQPANVEPLVGVSVSVTEAPVA
jgi:hypothetical protein